VSKKNGSSAQCGAPQVCRVDGRGVVELVDVGWMAGRSMVAGDGEGPVAEDQLGLDLGQDVPWRRVRPPGGGTVEPPGPAVGLPVRDRARLAGG